MAEKLGIGKVCPHCGARSATLGGVCPACRRAYVPGGLLERLPFMDSNDSVGVDRAAPLFALVLVGIAAGFVWLLVTDVVAGILLGALAFVLLVAAIGLANFAAERRR
jgi:hypothetical protein